LVFRLTPMELLVLLLSDRGYTLKEIADVLDIDEDMLNDVVQDLVEKGYAEERRRWKLFGYERYLVPTEEGKKALMEIAKVLKEVIGTVRGMVERGNVDGARAFISRYVEYLPYAPLLGVAEKSFMENLIKKMGIVPAYAPPESVYEESREWEEWEEEF